MIWIFFTLNQILKSKSRRCISHGLLLQDICSHDSNKKKKKLRSFASKVTELEQFLLGLLIMAISQILRFSRILEVILKYPPLAQFWGSRPKSLRCQMRTAYVRYDSTHHCKIWWEKWFVKEDLCPNMKKILHVPYKQDS